MKSGWEPIVLTEYVPDKMFIALAEICPVYRIRYYSQNKGFIYSLQRAFFLLLDVFFNYKNYKTYKEACRLIRSYDFSLILCSTYRTYPLCAAARAAKSKNIPWIADLRDIIEQSSGYEFISRPMPSIIRKAIAPTFAKLSMNRRNKAIRQARCVTTVSPWHVEILSRYNSNTKLIYNGYDPEIFHPESLPSPQFIVTYTGRIFNLALRTPALLFKALAELRDSGRISPADCRVHWYVDPVSWGIISEEAQRYGVDAFMDFKGMRPAPEIPEILNKSSVLLHLTNKSDASGPKGIMSTKLFEYLAMEKPILCVQSDESYVAELIRNVGAGLAASDSREVGSFLLNYYLQWKNQSFTSVRSNREFIADFSRERQAVLFIELFNRILNR